MAHDDSEVSAIGWEAINDVLRPVYGDQEPRRHYAPRVSSRLGGTDPLDGISVYDREEPTPHWHYVTFGFSELYEKEESDPDVSGYGFELTFRLARDPTDEEPPVWPLNFLQNLARYVFSTGRVFDVGHRMGLNGPIAANSETRITEIAFCQDPELKATDTPNGRLQFLQVVGLMADEFAAVQRWNTTGFLEVMRFENRLLVTDLWRPSILENPAVASILEAREEAAGSSTIGAFSDEVGWSIEQRPLEGRRLILSFGADSARTAFQVILRRLPYGQPYVFSSDEQAVRLSPGESFGWETDDSGCVTLTLPPQEVELLSDFLTGPRGTYVFPNRDDVLIRIEPTLIRDREGNVVQMIG